MVRPLTGPGVIVERLEDDPQGRATVVELSGRCEISDLDASGRRFKVVVDDAFGQEEAVVRLASQLDEIDPSWQRYLPWPRSSA